RRRVASRREARAAPGQPRPRGAVRAARGDFPFGARDAVGGPRGTLARREPGPRHPPRRPRRARARVRGRGEGVRAEEGRGEGARGEGRAMTVSSPPPEGAADRPPDRADLRRALELTPKYDRPGPRYT